MIGIFIFKHIDGLEFVFVSREQSEAADQYQYRTPPGYINNQEEDVLYILLFFFFFCVCVLDVALRGVFWKAAGGALQVCVSPASLWQRRQIL